MTTQFFTLKAQQPSDLLDHCFDFTDWLATNDTIVSADVTVGTGLTLAIAPPVVVTTTKVTFWLTGGESGQSYPVTIRAVTDGGRVNYVDGEILILDTTP